MQTTHISRVNKSSQNTYNGIKTLIFNVKRSEIVTLKRPDTRFLMSHIVVLYMLSCVCGFVAP